MRGVCRCYRGWVDDRVSSSVLSVSIRAAYTHTISSPHTDKFSALLASQPLFVRCSSSESCLSMRSHRSSRLAAEIKRRATDKHAEAKRHRRHGSRTASSYCQLLQRMLPLAMTLLLF